MTNPTPPVPRRITAEDQPQAPAEQVPQWLDTDPDCAILFTIDGKGEAAKREAFLRLLSRHAPQPPAVGEVTDTEIVEWLGRNYNGAFGQPRFEFFPFNALWHDEIKARWPNGYWREVFGPKDDTNRFRSLRSIVTAAMRSEKRGGA